MTHDIRYDHSHVHRTRAQPELPRPPCRCASPSAKTVAWTTGDAAVATVSGTGLVAAVANGTATVTATVSGVSGKAQVTVEQQVTAVEVTPAADTLASLGDTLRLSAVASDANGHAVAGAEVVWSSDQESVVAVSGTGLAEALSNGTATVTATAGGVSGEAKVTVEQQVAAVEVTPAAHTLASLGDTLRLSAEARDANGHAVERVQSFAWTSGNASVATVDGSGLATAVGNGTAAIGSEAEGVSGSATLTVAQVVTEVVVTPPVDTMVSLMDTVRLAAEARDANGNAVERVRSFAWTSGDESVATVDGSGLATAVRNGTAAIGAEAEGVSGSATLTVAQVVTEVIVAPSADTLVSLGDTLRLSAEALDANGHAVVDAEVGWSSDQESVVAVDGTGLAEALSNGTATVTATAGGVSGEAQVTVEQQVAAVEVTPAADTLVSLGDTLRLSAEASDANGHAVVDAEVGWSSDQESVATVSGTGLVAAVANGRATVTATAGGVSGEAEVTVEQQVAAVEVTPAADTLVSLGDTLRLSAEAFDANGHAVADTEGWVVVGPGVRRGCERHGAGGGAVQRNGDRDGDGGRSLGRGPGDGGATGRGRGGDSGCGHAGVAGRHAAPLGGGIRRERACGDWRRSRVVVGRHDGGHGGRDGGW